MTLPELLVDTLKVLESRDIIGVDIDPHDSTGRTLLLLDADGVEWSLPMRPTRWVACPAHDATHPPTECARCGGLGSVRPLVPAAPWLADKRQRWGAA